MWCFFTKAVFISITVFCSSTFSVFSQTKIFGIPEIINYTSASIKEITQTLVIKQDKKGIMYFGNSYGISIFDGTNWQIIKLRNNSSVRSMSISKNGNVYVGGMDELGYLKPDGSGILKYHSLHDKIPEEFQDFGVVNDIFILKDDIVFLCDANIFILQNDTIRLITEPAFYDKGFVVSENLFVYKRNQGLMKLINDKFSPINGSKILNEHPPVALFKWKNSELLAFTKEGGAFIYNDSTFKPFLHEELKSLYKSKINCGIQTKSGNIILGTVLKGIIILSQEGKPLLNIHKNWGLDNNNILSLFVDSYDNLWVGHDNGVTHIETNSPFTYINNQIVPGAGYASVSYKGMIYLGTSQGLFATKHKRENNLLSLPEFRLINGTEGMVWNLTNHKGTLLMGHEKGTFLIDGYKIKEISPIPGGWSFQELKANPDYLIEGCYSGFLLYKKNENEYQFSHRIMGFDESCRIFEQDDKGHIWIAHGYKGLFRIQLDSALKKAIDIRFYDEKYGFPSNLGINVFKINNQIIFTSENGGIFTYNEKTDRFETNKDFEQYLGITPGISKMFEDESGNIWVNEINRTGILVKQNNGTYRYQFRPFNKLKNALIRGFEHFGKLPDKSTLFGFGNGFIHYNPSIKNGVNYPFYSIIRRVEILNESDSIIYGGFRISKTDSSMIFPHKHNSLRFTFSAPYFEDIEKTQYSYFLDGFDKTWSNWTNKTDREYTNLPAGNYKFQIKSKNIYGTESYEDIYSFKISTPLYQTWWAYFIYFILGFVLLRKSFQIYSKQRENKLRFENIQKERQIIELKNLQLNAELEQKSNELGSLTSLIVNKNAFLQQIKNFLNDAYNNLGAKDKKEIITLTRKIDSEADIDKEWNLIEPHFDSVHKGFLTKLKENYPQLRPHDLKLCAYIHMNLRSKEIAVLMNNTPRGIEAHRYRLRKLFGITRETNLKNFLNSL